ncbi:cupin domain-containing protein [Streptomyces sp. F001]|uniref:cupin domain-containing protein n=1 Tax=Streptomyces sp. F001 TaxID=1510026 RepID=UPI0019D0FDBF|nr:cupin domain-containing protein [Streptomyces sp. F001]
MTEGSESDTWEAVMAALRLVVEPDEGNSIWLAGLGVDFKLGGEDTGNQFSILEHLIEPGRLIPPHVHSREDEFTYVLQGRVGARVGDHEATAGPGSYIIKPREILHTVWNAGPEPARVLEIISPAGFEGFFEELGRAAETAADPAEFLQRRAELGERHGLGFSDEWVAELTARYGLKLLGEP